MPHVGQTPLIAGLPFFNVIFSGFFISLFALHLKQYASVIQYHLLSSLLNIIVSNRDVKPF